MPTTVNKESEVGDGDIDLVTRQPDTHISDGLIEKTYISGTSRSGGHSISTSGRGSGGTGGHGGSGGGGEKPKHRELKERLAANPSLLGAGLKLVSIEYSFKSGDRVDIFLKDSSGKPVTIEIETGFSSHKGRYVGVWQAVKYKHLAAVESGLPCDEVRSILAAPTIPDDVKKECQQLRIEPFEVPELT